MNFGTHLKEQREINGLSQRNLSKLTNISNSTISRIEANECIPNLETIIKLTEVLKLDLNTLKNN